MKKMNKLFTSMTAVLLSLGMVLGTPAMHVQAEEKSETEASIGERKSNNDGTDYINVGDWRVKTFENWNIEEENGIYYIMDSERGSMVVARIPEVTEEDLREARAEINGEEDTSETTESEVVVVEYGDYDAMTALNETLGNFSFSEEDVFIIDGMINKGMSSFSIQEANEAGNERRGRVFYVNGFEDSDYPADGTRICIKASPVIDGLAVYLEVEPEDFYIVEEGEESPIRSLISADDDIWDWYFEYLTEVRESEGPTHVTDSFSLNGYKSFMTTTNYTDQDGEYDNYDITEGILISDGNILLLDFYRMEDFNLNAFMEFIDMFTSARFSKVSGAEPSETDTDVEDDGLIHLSWVVDDSFFILENDIMVEATTYDPEKEILSVTAANFGEQDVYLYVPYMYINGYKFSFGEEYALGAYKKLELELPADNTILGMHGFDDVNSLGLYLNCLVYEDPEDEDTCEVLYYGNTIEFTVNENADNSIPVGEILLEDESGAMLYYLGLYSNNGQDEFHFLAVNYSDSKAYYDASTITVDGNYDEDFYKYLGSLYEDEKAVFVLPVDSAEGADSVETTLSIYDDDLNDRDTGLFDLLSFYGSGQG